MSEYRDALSALHVALVDSRNAYEEAREDAGPQGLVTLFESMIALRQGAAVELEPLLVAAGAEPDDDGSLRSTVQRTIISLQSMISDLDEAILPGLIDGERQILDQYDAAIRLTEPQVSEPQARDVLARQRAALVERMAEMERRLRKAA